jgi:hypothetical protein
VPLYALISSDAQFAVDLFVSEDAAQRALGEVLADEPAFEELLSIVEIESPVFELTPQAFVYDQ